MSILQLVARAEAPLTLTDIVRLSGIPLSSAHGLLRELTATGALREVERHGYVVGPGLISLSLQVLSGVRALEVAKRAMLSLVARLDEDVYLAMPGSDGMFYAHRELGSQSLRVAVPLGMERPLHATAIGQLFLCLLPEDERKTRLKEIRLDARTDRTITDLDELEARLDETRSRGYARSDGENVEGILAYAAPIFDHSGELVAALSISLVRDRGIRREPELVPMLVRSARDASSELGWAGAVQPEQASAGDEAALPRRNRGARVVHEK